METKGVKVVKKYVEYVLTKASVLRQQRTFRYQGVNLKYMYMPLPDTKVLTVVFSACTRKGLPARYNYVKSLAEMKCNRLYLLDDFGVDKRGSFYLGRMPEWKEQEAAIALIKNVIAKVKPEKVLFCGSCKGGYGALNIGSRFQNAIMIVGEPAYRIATEFSQAKELLQYWMGDISDAKKGYMDDYLSEQLKQNPYIPGQRIHLFYSIRDEYYETHTKPLLQDLQERGYWLEEEKSEFKAHSELSLYFPDFLKTWVRYYT